MRQDMPQLDPGRAVQREAQSLPRICQCPTYHLGVATTRTVAATHGPGQKPPKKRPNKLRRHQFPNLMFFPHGSAENGFIRRRERVTLLARCPDDGAERGATTGAPSRATEIGRSRAGGTGLARFSAALGRCTVGAAAGHPGELRAGGGEEKHVFRCVLLV